MSKIVIPSAAVGRRQVMASAGAVGLVSALATPAIAQNKPIRMGWIAAVTGMFASNAQAQDWGSIWRSPTSMKKAACWAARSRS